MPQQREPCFYNWLLVPSNHNKRNTDNAFLPASLPASVLKSWLRSLWIANRRTLRHPMRHKILCKVAQLYMYINTTTTFQHLATQNWYWDRCVYHITAHHGDPYVSFPRQTPLETTPALIKNALYADDSSNMQGSSQLQTIEVPSVHLTVWISGLVYHYCAQ